MLESQSAKRRDHSFIAGLESIRGLAALVVCLSHASALKIGGQPLVAPETGKVLFPAPGAVILFFVLSGFVLRLSLEKKTEQPWPNVSLGFLIGRFFRLYPVIIATTLIAAALQWIAQGKHVSMLEILRNASLLSIDLNGQFWTLQAEIFGSLLVLIAFLVERMLGVIAVVAMAAALVPLSFLGQHWTFGHQIPQLLYLFLFGYLTALATEVFAGWGAQKRWLLPAALVLFCAVPFFGYAFKQWWLFLTAFSGSLLVGIVACRRYRFLEWRALRMMGVLSFSFYALHGLGLLVASKFADPLSVAAAPRFFIVAIALTCAVAVSVALAVAMHYLVERPGNGIGYKLRAFFHTTA